MKTPYLFSWQKIIKIQRGDRNETIKKKAYFLSFSHQQTSEIFINLVEIVDLYDCISLLIKLVLVAVFVRGNIGDKF